MTSRVAAAVALTFALWAAALAQQNERVDGFGGFFFRAKEPKVLAQWYRDQLGINLIPTDYDHEPWKQLEGYTAFAPMSEGTKMWRADKAFMLNFRVKNLDAMAAQLRNAGIKVDVDPMTYPNGRFAELEDPEGNPIQLWEPKGKK